MFVLLLPYLTLPLKFLVALRLIIKSGMFITSKLNCQIETKKLESSEDL